MTFFPDYRVTFFFCCLRPIILSRFFLENNSFLFCKFRLLSDNITVYLDRLRGQVIPKLFFLVIPKLFFLVIFLNLLLRQKVDRFKQTSIVQKNVFHTLLFLLAVKLFSRENHNKKRNNFFKPFNVIFWDRDKQIT